MKAELALQRLLVAPDKLEGITFAMQHQLDFVVGVDVSPMGTMRRNLIESAYLNAASVHDDAAPEFPSWDVAVQNDADVDAVETET